MYYIDDVGTFYTDVKPRTALFYVYSSSIIIASDSLFMIHALPHVLNTSAGKSVCI